MFDKMRAAAAFFLFCAAATNTARIAHASAHPAKRTFSIAKQGEPIVLPVEIAGTPYRLLLDTGSSVSSLDKVLRPLLGDPRRRVPVRTQSHDDAVSAELFLAPRIVLGGEAVRGISEVTCLDYRAFKQVNGEIFEGVLGMDALYNMILQIDFDEGQLSILPSVPEGAGRQIELVSCYGVPSVRLQAIGTDAGLFWIDTGASGNSGTLRSRRFRSLREAGGLSVLGDAPVASAFSVTNRRLGKLAQFRLAGFEHRGLIFNEGSMNSLSLDYLSRYLVTFDFANERMYLRPGRRFHEPDVHDVTGLHLVRVNGETVVESLEEFSPAARAGMRTGDALTAVNGTPVKTLTMTKTRRLLATQSVISIHYRRGRHVLHAELRP